MKSLINLEDIIFLIIVYQVILIFVVVKNRSKIEKLEKKIKEINK